LLDDETEKKLDLIQKSAAGRITGQGNIEFKIKPTKALSLAK
jgi:predicted RNase H-related nuclease YkuK (DUF458 family)